MNIVLIYYSESTIFISAPNAEVDPDIKYSDIFLGNDLHVKFDGEVVDGIKLLGYPELEVIEIANANFSGVVHRSGEHDVRWN